MVTNNVQYDAIVIGTGFAGAVTICRLAQANLKVCVLERGRNFRKGDFPELSTADIGLIDESGDSFDSEPIGSALPRQLWNTGHGLWELRDLGDVVVGQAAGYGGGSLIYANVHLRPDWSVFDNWPAPYRNQSLRPYFDLAAYMLDVGLMPQEISESLEKHHQMGRLWINEDEMHKTPLSENIIELPLAVNFGGGNGGYPQNNTSECDLRGNCWFGCNRGAKNTLDKNYLHEAETLAKDRLSILTLCNAENIEKRRDSGFEVTYTDLNTNITNSVSGKYVFVCAGAVNTTELLCKAAKSGLKEEFENSPLTSNLGTRYHSNADAIAAVFDCDEPHIPTVGPTITRAYLYSPGDFHDNDWFLVQDAGIPAALEPFMGIFRSPLWARRNRFKEIVNEFDDPSGDTTYMLQPNSARYALMSDNVPKNVASRIFADSRWSAITLGSREIIRRRNLEKYNIDDTVLGMLPKLIVDQLTKDFRQFATVLKSFSRPQVASLIKLVADQSHTQLGLTEILESLLGGVDTSTGQDGNDHGWRSSDAMEWFLRSALRALAGSEYDLVSNTLNSLRDQTIETLSSTDKLQETVVQLLIVLLDHRQLDGFSTMLLLMGKDTHTGNFQFGTSDNPNRLIVNVDDSAGRRAFKTQQKVLRHFARKCWKAELRTNPLNRLGKRISVHNQGGAPMGDDPDKSITDSNGSVHGIDGLYVMDASAFPGPVGVNPSASVLAVAEYKIKTFLETHNIGMGTAHQQQIDLASEWARTKTRSLDPINHCKNPLTIKNKPNIDLVENLTPRVTVYENLSGSFAILDPNHDDYGIVHSWLKDPTTSDMALPKTEDKFREWTETGNRKSQLIDLRRLGLSIEDLDEFLEQDRNSDRCAIRVPKFNAKNPTLGFPNPVLNLNPEAYRSTEKNSWVQMFTHHPDPDFENVCLMQYSLRYKICVNGEAQATPMTFTGLKVMSGGTLFEMLDQTTSLRFVLSFDELNDHPLFVGSVRLDTQSLIDAIKTIEVEGFINDTFQKSLQARRFLSYFVKHLNEIYTTDSTRILTQRFFDEFVTW